MVVNSLLFVEEGWDRFSSTIWMDGWAGIIEWCDKDNLANDAFAFRG